MSDVSKNYLATVHILVEAADDTKASDFLHALLEAQDGIVDWGYVSGPTKVHLPLSGKDAYNEGDLYRLVPQ